MTRILIADDEAAISSFIKNALGSRGFSSITVPDGRSALDLALSTEFDLLILDIGLPELDGFTVLRRLREEKRVLPIIILSVRDSASDTVAGLAGGADDYMSKPFSVEELLARVQLRLLSNRGQEITVLRSGSLSLDLRTRRAEVDGHLVDLSAREFAIAEEFVRHPGEVLSRAHLLSHVWGFDFDPSSNLVEVYIRQLRRKVGKHRIQTVHRMGYRLWVDVPDAAVPPPDTRRGRTGSRTQGTWPRTRPTT